jgi:hypothetical protein
MQVLANLARYHASTVPVDAVRVLIRKLLRWPLDKVFPAVDVLRVLLTHPDGSEAVALEAGLTFVRQNTERIAAARIVPALRPVVLLTARALSNSFASDGMRAVITVGAGDVLRCANDLLQYDNAVVKLAACTLLQNISHMFQKQQQRAIETSSAEVATSGPIPTMSSSCSLFLQRVCLLSMVRSKQTLQSLFSQH